MSDEIPLCQDCGAPAVGVFLGPKTETPRVIVICCERCGSNRSAALQRAVLRVVPTARDDSEGDPS